MTLVTPKKSNIQNNLGEAYVNSIVTHSGFIFKETLRHDYGIDGQICGLQKYTYSYGTEYNETDFLLKFQLKSIYDYEVINDHIVYDLNIKNYHELIRQSVIKKILILVLFCDEIVEAWIDQPLILNYDTRLNYCAIWGSLEGLPTVNNETQKRIKIPCKNIFNKESLTNIMSKLEKGDILERNVTI